MSNPMGQEPIEDTRCDLRTRGYLPIENYGIIGNLRTVALCGTDGSMDFCCYPVFDSPSIFCRLLDKEKGGHFSIGPHDHTSNKQQYLPKSNILVTRFMSEEGVLEITDYMHIPRKNQRTLSKPFLPWIIRVARVVRGEVSMSMECFPAFNYARDSHTTNYIPMPAQPPAATLSEYPENNVPYFVCNDRVEFKSKDMTMDLRYIVRHTEGHKPDLNLKIHKSGRGVHADFTMIEDEEVTFILRQVPDKDDLPSMDPALTPSLTNALFRQTWGFWQEWIDQSSYTGRWRENVIRSALTLKLLTYEPTGAVVAAPTFGIPESIGGERNWDYRYIWIRDSSFTIYAFLKLGFTEEASKYMSFIEDRCNDLNPDGSLNIMYGIRGEKRLDELVLDHLEGYRESAPVRIGNGAYDHLQLDIYGELLDGVYLFNKYGSPVSYSMWCAVRKLVDYVCDNYNTPDMSIWEVRGRKQHFTYSLVMCWVAVDRGLRLADKRMFPCPDRNKWLETRDTIYEMIQHKCWNPTLKIYTQSIEAQDAVDAACLIMPLVFFSSPVDPRFMSTVERILMPPEKGGLTANNLVFRYNVLTTDDGFGGGLEGAFSMCTFWLVEALARAGRYDKKYMTKAIIMFEEMLSYANHLGLFSEEVARSGELLGNVPQAFSHLAFISAAFNLNRAIGPK